MHKNISDKLLVVMFFCMFEAYVKSYVFVTFYMEVRLINLNSIYYGQTIFFF